MKQLIIHIKQLNTHYINPETKQSCELEEAMEYLLKLREEYFNKYLK